MPDLNRIRDLRDEAGHVLRVGTQGWHRSVVLVLEDEAADGGQSIVLDSYGAEMLAGYIMAARMTVPDPLPVERIAGSFPSLFSVHYGPDTQIVIEQRGDDRQLAISRPFWERLYAELWLAIPRMRVQFDSSVPATLQ